jgi:hypothetical protein
MSTPGIEVQSECPYCGHKNARVVRAVIGSKNGDHFCRRCGQQYEEHYVVSVVLNTYPIAKQYRQEAVAMQEPAPPQSVVSADSLPQSTLCNPTAPSSL